MSGRDDKVAFTLTVPQVLLALALSLGGFLSRILADPLVTSQVGIQDAALVASIWMIWAAAAGLVVVLTRFGAQGGATVIGLCLAGAAVSFVEVMTPTFLLPLNTFVLIHLALAMFGLALAFRLVPQILPDGQAARWSDMFGTLVLPACAVVLFVAVTPLGQLSQSATTFLAEQRASVEAGRLASVGQVTPGTVVALAATSAAPQQMIAPKPSATAPIQASSAQGDDTTRAALALLLLTVGSASGTANAAW